MPPGARRLACALLAVAVLGCETYVEGNGVFDTADRSGVAPFAGVRVEDAVQATVQVAEGAEKLVQVSGDANLLEYIRTEVVTESVLGVDVEVLRITVGVPGGSYSPKLPIRATVRTPSVRYLSAREAATIEPLPDVAMGVTATDLVLDASSGGSIVADGAGGASLHATARDATVDASAYPVDYAAVALWGHSHVTTDAAQLSGEAHGTSTVVNVRADGACGVDLFDAATVDCASAP